MIWNSGFIAGIGLYIILGARKVVHGRLSPLLLGPEGQQDWQLGKEATCKEGESEDKCYIGSCSYHYSWPWWHECPVERQQGDPADSVSMCVSGNGAWYPTSTDFQNIMAPVSLWLPNSLKISLVVNLSRITQDIDFGKHTSRLGSNCEGTLDPRLNSGFPVLAGEGCWKLTRLTDSKVKAVGPSAKLLLWMLICC